MQRVNDDMWIKLGPEDGDKLRYAPICGVEGGETLFRFDAEHEPPEPLADGHDVLVLFNGPKGFMQQPACVTIRPADEGPIMYGFVTTGDAVSAENRDMFRIGVALADYKAEVDAADTCKVADVSVLGIAVLSEHLYELGQVVEVSFTLEGETFTGRCRVKSIKPLAVGARYGLLCLNGADAGDLENGLRKLTMDAQRSQLRRMSRAG